MSVFDFNVNSNLSSLFNVEDITDIFNWIPQLISMVFSMIGALLNALQTLLDGLLSIISVIDNMITAIMNDNVEDVPILEAVGVYRYLVGDVVFHLTYLMLVAECCLVIFRLVLIIKRRFSDSVDISGAGMFNQLFRLVK